MSTVAGILTAEQMRRLYGDFYESSPRLHLDRRNVPERFWPLLPYAEFWGITDETARNQLVRRAPADARGNLKEVIYSLDNAMDEWLAGPEANDPLPSDEYVAFSAMRMAAYYVPVVSNRSP